MFVYHHETFELFHYYDPTSHELERIDQLVAHSLRRSVSSKNCCFSAVRTVLYDQDSVRISPTVLAAACRTPPICIASSHVQHGPPSPPSQL